jgi:hypothetical protein
MAATRRAFDDYRRARTVLVRTSLALLEQWRVSGHEPKGAAEIAFAVAGATIEEFAIYDDHDTHV